MQSNHQRRHRHSIEAWSQTTKYIASLQCMHAGCILYKIQTYKYTNTQIHKYRNRHCSAVCRLYSVQKERDRLPPTPLPGKHDTKPLRSSKAANLFLGGFLYDGGTSQRKELLGQLIKPHAFPLLSHLQVHLS